jgi:queuine tRNA-ribosyltransferase
MTKEILGCRLATIHNLHYYLTLMMDIREALDQGVFLSYYEKKAPVLKEAYPDKVNLEGSEAQ